MVDVYLDYYLIKKAKKSFKLGLDLNFQDFSHNHSFQTASFAPRFGQSLLLTKDLRFEYTLSFGKILTNGIADQNYTFGSAFWYYQISEKVELQPSISYFENLNNAVPKQYSASVLVNFYLDNDFFGLVLFTKKVNLLLQKLILLLLLFR